MGTETFLIADIGATHARFALRGGGDLSPTATAGAAPIVLPTADFHASGELVQAAMEGLGVESIDGGCFAVAGPVTDGRVEITNGGMSFCQEALSHALGCEVLLVNDFFAVAKAVPALKQLERIGGRDVEGMRAVKAVLGPGSGLGMSVLIPDGERSWRVLPSEGGHADLAPGNHLEQEVLSILQTNHDAVCWETVLSGPGLRNLYRAVAAMWGAEPEDFTPEEISARGVDADDPICHQTLELFFGFLGSVAGNLALTVCAASGVYIGGGIVPSLRGFAVTSPLRRRFDERAGLETFVADIPLYLILEENPGLIGAEASLMESDRK